MGIRGETVTDVSQRLLAHHGGLRGLFRLDVAELARVHGLGDAKAVRVKAALELERGWRRSRLSLLCASCDADAAPAQWRKSRVSCAFLLKKDCGSLRLPSRPLVLTHSLAWRTFTTKD